MSKAPPLLPPSMNSETLTSETVCDHIPKSLLGAPWVRGRGKSLHQFLQSVSSLGNVGLQNADKKLPSTNYLANNQFITSRGRGVGRGHCSAVSMETIK